MANGPWQAHGCQCTSAPYIPSSAHNLVQCVPSDNMQPATGYFLDGGQDMYITVKTEIYNSDCISLVITEEGWRGQNGQACHVQRQRGKGRCKVFITLLIGVSMVETLFTPVYGTVH